MKITKTGLIRKINALASSPFELIVIDSSTGVAYQRNTDWEWAGGNLYNPIGTVPQEALIQERIFHPNVHLEENFGEIANNDRGVPAVIYCNNLGGIL